VHHVEKCQYHRAVVLAKSVKDPVTLTLESPGCDSQWQNNITIFLLYYTAGLGAFHLACGSLPFSKLNGMLNGMLNGRLPSPL
jgi:hypothetical protein